MESTVRALIVDDDPVSLLLMETILLRLGLQVTTERDPQRALATMRAEPGRFDLLLTDFQMPGLSGAELVTSVSRELPHLPIVMVSSRLEEALGQIDSALLDAQVAKPFGEVELSAALCRALDERSQGATDSGVWTV